MSSTHGGRRPGAGRKPARFRADAPHRPRPALSARHPVHVVLRVMPYITELRTRARYHVIRRVLERYLGRADFRVVHLSIQNTHLHLIVEAADRGALTRGMQSFAINCARALNRKLGAHGKVFAHRYHATQIRTARQARHALAYVLNNWRRHQADVVDLTAPVDPYASGITFTGWTKRLELAPPSDYVPLPTSPPHARLLVGHRLDPFEVPGPLR